MCNDEIEAGMAADLVRRIREARAVVQADEQAQRRGCAPAHTRRVALALFAGAPALAVFPAAALALPVDPIFSAIELHKAAEVVFSATLNGQDEAYAEQHGREVTQANLDAFEAAGAEEEAAIEALLETVPLT